MDNSTEGIMTSEKMKYAFVSYMFSGMNIDKKHWQLKKQQAPLWLWSLGASEGLEG